MEMSVLQENEFKSGEPAWLTRGSHQTNPIAVVEIIDPYDVTGLVLIRLVTENRQTREKPGTFMRVSRMKLKKVKELYDG